MRQVTLADELDLDVAHADLVDEIVKGLGVLRVEPHAAMRGNMPQMLHIGRAVNGITSVIEDRPRLGSVLVLRGVPDLTHAFGSKGPLRRRMPGATGRD